MYFGLSAAPDMEIAARTDTKNDVISPKCSDPSKHTPSKAAIPPTIFGNVFTKSLCEAFVVLLTESSSAASKIV